MSNLAKEFTVATHIMQGSSNDLSTLVFVRQKCKQTKATK